MQGVLKAKKRRMLKLRER